MELRRNIRGCFSPTLFALVGLAFFLTFATISYGDAQTTFTGAQLVTQTVPRGGTANDDYTCSGEVSDCVHGGGSAKATIVLLAAALGSLLAAFGIRGAGLCTVVGLGATLALASPVLELFAGPSMDFGRGYVATLLLLLAASAVGIVRSVFDRMDFPRRGRAPVRSGCS